jgi:hypothetical protein
VADHEGIDTEETTQQSGRSISVTARGNTADEIELNAIDQARQVIGSEPQLRVVRDYEIRPTLDYPPGSPDWYAMVTVQVVE